MTASDASNPALATGAEKRPLGRRLMMIGGLVLLSLAALAGGLAAALGPSELMAMITGSKAEAAATDSADPAATAGEGGGHGAAATGAEGAGHGPDRSIGALSPNLTLLPFREIIVNVTDLTTAGRRTTRFLKLNFAVVYDSNVEGADQVEARQLYMRDSFQDYLRQLTVRDLQGSLGLASLKAELLRRARAISGTDAPTEILVSDLIIQ